MLSKYIGGNRYLLRNLLEEKLIRIVLITIILLILLGCEPQSEKTNIETSDTTNFTDNKLVNEESSEIDIEKNLTLKAERDATAISLELTAMQILELQAFFEYNQMDGSKQNEITNAKDSGLFIEIKIGDQFEVIRGNISGPALGYSLEIEYNNKRYICYDTDILKPDNIIKIRNQYEEINFWDYHE